MKKLILSIIILLFLSNCKIIIIKEYDDYMGSYNKSTKNKN